MEVVNSMLVLPAIAAALAYALTWLARRVAPSLGFVDKPDGGRKRHARPIPLLGGAAVFGSLLLVILGVWLFDGRDAMLLDAPLLPLLGSGMAFCAIGLWDDRYGLKASNKFMLQVVASLPFAMFGPAVGQISLLGMSMDLGNLSIPFTVFWLVSCANIINLIDGLDGLATTVGLIATVALGSLALMDGHASVGLVTLVAGGSMLGFLFHNLPPARIFLGDTGSLTIGYLVGAISIQAPQKTSAGVMLALPVALLSVPMLDTAMAIIRRKLSGRGIGDADRGHIHHLLQDRGLSKLQTLLVVGSLSTLMAGATVFADVWRMELLAVCMCVGVIGMLICGRVFGFHETVLVFRHVRVLQRLISDGAGRFGTQALLARMDTIGAPDREQLWTSLRTRVSQMGGTDVNCAISSGGQLRSQWSWTSDLDGQIEGTRWNLYYTVELGDNAVATLEASGYPTERATTGRADDVFELLAAFGNQELLATSEDSVTDEPAAEPRRIAA